MSLSLNNVQRTRSSLTVYGRTKFFQKRNPLSCNSPMITATQNNGGFTVEMLSIEMPLVKRCDVNNCGFNVGSNCHAKAITVGDGTNPGCDTFFNNASHTHETVRIAGVGACKVSGCEFNDDFECMAENITVGFVAERINCRTYRPKQNP